MFIEATLKKYKNAKRNPRLKKNINEQPQFKKGDKVKLRIVNGGASTYFWLTYGGGKVTLVGNDGNDVEPVEVDHSLMFDLVD